MKCWYELKVRAVLGGEIGDDVEVSILGRKLVWKDDEITYEADPRHSRIICESMGLDSGSKGLTSPIVKDSLEELLEGSDPLSLASATEFRSIAARGNYLALDRADIQYATKEVCRDMSAPTALSVAKLKRLARYLLDYPSLVWSFKEFEDTLEYMDVFGDSDWAGCLKTRRSTSGGIASIEGCAVKTWSSTQATPALSSGEAEYYSLVKAAAEGLGIQSLLIDLGWSVKLRVWIDATAAKGVASRTGLGKIRHMETRVLWVQQALKAGRFSILKIPGKVNPADVLTKPGSAHEMADRLQMVGAFLKTRGAEDDVVDGSCAQVDADFLWRDSVGAGLQVASGAKSFVGTVVEKCTPTQERKSWFDESVEEFGEAWLSGVAAEDEHTRSFNVREVSPGWVGKNDSVIRQDSRAEGGCWHNVTPLESIPFV
jgi:hypothetical protein